MFGPVLIGALGTSNFDTDVGQLVLTDSFFLIGSLAAIKIVPHFALPARHLVDFRNYGCVLGSLVSGPSPNKFRCLSVALDLRIELWRPERIGLCLSG